MTLKLVIRRTVSALLSNSGIHGMLEYRHLAEQAFVLMYHRVLSSFANQPYYVQPGMYVTSETFERQIVHLLDTCEVIPFNLLVEKLCSGELIGRQCALTFDDGWRDNYSVAFPLLKKYQIPATIFLSSGFVGTARTFWPEELCCLLGRTGLGGLTSKGAPPAVGRFARQIEGIRYKDESSLFEYSIALLKKYYPAEREEILVYLRSSLGSGEFPRQMLSWEEAKEMAQSGLVSFGAHTVNHQLLDQLSLQQASDEISRSRSEIENRLGQKIASFAYPNGNHSADIRRIVAESGFSSAVTTRKGFVDKSVPLLEIPRIAVHEDVSYTVAMFRSKILLQRF